MNNDLISKSTTTKMLREYADQKCSRGEVELANGILKAGCYIEGGNIPAANGEQDVCEPEYLGENTAIGCRIGKCKCGNIVRSYHDFCNECGVKLNWDNVYG